VEALAGLEPVGDPEAADEDSGAEDDCFSHCCPLGVELAKGQGRHRWKAPRTVPPLFSDLSGGMGRKRRTARRAQIGHDCLVIAFNDWHRPHPPTYRGAGIQTPITYKSFRRREHRR
jgi:hypothetical protein